MYTIVDVGSNTIRMNVYDIRDDKLRLLFSKKATAGLASYVKDKRMSAAGVDRVVEVLEDFQETLANLNIPEMHVCATASLRNVENSSEAVAEIERRTGVHVQVLSGREEAEDSLLELVKRQYVLLNFLWVAVPLSPFYSLNRVHEPTKLIRKCSKSLIPSRR